MENKSLEDLQNMTLAIMKEMKDKHSEKTEYKTIMMNLTTVSKELNVLRNKEVSGELDN